MINIIMSSKVDEINEDAQAKILHKMIEMVTRQTNYSYNDAKEHLMNNNWDYNIVLREYMGIPEKKEKSRTVNQEIFKQIRKKMDIAGNKYYST